MKTRGKILEQMLMILPVTVIAVAGRICNQTEPSLLLSVNRDYENLYTFTLEK